MKIEKFLNSIQDKLLNYKNLDFKTTKTIINIFVNCLSKKEKERFSLQIQIIKEFFLKESE